MKRIAAMLVLIALLLLPCAHASNDYSVLTNCDIMRRGSRGDNVRRIQQALINMGYLSGNADGSYGSKTEAAVRDFQWKNGITQSGVATMFTQAKLFGDDAIYSWNNNRLGSYSTGNYDVYNSDGRSWNQYEVTVSFDFVNRDSNNVEAICIYYWLADSRNNLVKRNGYEYYMQWYYGMNLPSGGSKSTSLTLSVPSSAWKKMDTVRCIVGEIAYTDGSVVVSMNASKKPYENPNYILLQCQ